MKKTQQVEFSDDASDDEETGGGFNINKDFARKYDHNQMRAEKHRLQEKYGKDESKWDDEENESSYGSEEDSDAELLTEKVDTKFKDLIHRI